jgi:hypothetical protein
MHIYKSLGCCCYTLYVGLSLNLFISPESHDAMAELFPFSGTEHPLSRKEHSMYTGTEHSLSRDGTICHVPSRPHPLQLGSSSPWFHMV